jgi:hypothetical protein
VEAYDDIEVTLNGSEVHAQRRSGSKLKTTWRFEEPVTVPAAGLSLEVMARYREHSAVAARSDKRLVQAGPEKLEPVELQDSQTLIIRNAGGVEAWTVPEGVRLRSKAMAPYYVFLVSNRAEPDIEMCLVIGGEFPFGKTAEKQVVDPFLMDRTEMSVGRYAHYLNQVGAGPGVVPRNWNQPERPADCVLTGVSYFQAERFLQWAGKSLPREAEWELAASWDGQEKHLFPWGAQFHEGRILNATEDLPKVGSNPSDRSPWGVLDLGGGVMEWCSGAAGTERPIRGGTALADGLLDQTYTRFSDGDRLAGTAAEQIFHTHRGDRESSDDQYTYIGFRCVLRLRKQ